MGSKRPYVGQDPLQPSYKYSKQFASDEKLISFADENLAPVACMLPGIDTNDKLKKPSLLVDPLDDKSIKEVHYVTDGALVDGLHFPCIGDSFGNDNDWYSDFQRFFLPDYCISSGSPRRAPVKADDVLSAFLNRYPRKQVPIGADHQADLPERESFNSCSSYDGSRNSDQVSITDEERTFMGTCVIPMPDSSLLAASSLSAGVGRKDCECVDKASVRCVRQHVKEARDKLVKMLGEGVFQELGFLDMGEEVSNKWSEEEEQVFHEIIFSNPASAGKDFWACLFEEFHTRSVKDIVSYYFNVFMLRKRADQNRSQFLDIDSDDDEWHSGHGHPIDLDFAGEDDGNCSFDEGDSSSDEEKESPQLNVKSPHKDNDAVPVNKDGSFSSINYQSSIDNLSPITGSVPNKEMNRIKNNYEYVSLSSDMTQSDGGLNLGCSVDSNNFRQWDHGFSAGLDHLLPTENMIEEIFGPGSWDYRPNHD